MMSDFLTAHKITAKNEGGYSDIGSDRGNWTGGRVGKGFLIGTNYGVSAPVLAEYLGRTPTVAEMKTLPIKTAHKIFKKYYWDKMRGDEIEIQEVANILYDTCILEGCSSAIKKSQRVLNLPETGKMNDSTLAELNNNV